jgi:sec-independent protein translocase protein TatC
VSFKLSNSNELDFNGHLAELRHRLVVSIVALAICIIGVYIKAIGVIYDYLLQIGSDAGLQFIYVAPQDVVIQKLRLTITCGLLIAMPVLLYELVSFVAPAFEINLKKIIFLLEACVIIIGVLAILFVLQVLLPIVLTYFSGYNTGDIATMQISVKEYMSLVISFCMCSFCMFSMPVVLLILSKLGLVTYSMLKTFRGVFIVVIFIVAAIITPPDVITQCIVAIPAVALYQLSIVLVKITNKRNVDILKEDI